MIESGLLVFSSVLFLLIKLPRRQLLWLLGRALLLDIAVCALTLLIHWGTFSGVMAATIAGLLTSVATSVMRRLIGYIRGNTYYPGHFRLQL